MACDNAGLRRTRAGNRGPRPGLCWAPDGISLAVVAVDAEMRRVAIERVELRR